MSARPLPWASALAVALILALTLLPLPVSSGPSLLPGLDKLVHAGMFGLLALAFGKDLRPFMGRTALLGCLAALGLALGTELAQTGIAGRGADVWDALADLAGFCAGAAAFHLYALKGVKIS